MSRIMPAMSDARAFTDYTSAGQREATMQLNAGASNESQYREFLQTNALAVARESKKVENVTQAFTNARFR